MQSHHHEVHYVQRTAWLRAAVLGANDGIVSTASLVLGVAAAGAEHRTILLTQLCAIAVLLNPSGLSIYPEVLNVRRQPGHVPNFW